MKQDGDFQLYESDGKFGLSHQPRSFAAFDDGSLGTGSSMTLMRFDSAEARAYYIRAHNADRDAVRAIRELAHFKSALMACLTPKGRIRRPRLNALIWEAQGKPSVFSQIEAKLNKGKL